MPQALYKWLWKRRYLRRLADSAREKEAMAVYAGETIERMVDIVTEAEHKRTELVMEQERIVKQETTLAGKERYEAQQQVKHLAQSIEVQNVLLAKHNKNLENMRENKAELESQAGEMWKRREVINQKY